MIGNQLQQRSRRPKPSTSSSSGARVPSGSTAQLVRNSSNNSVRGSSTSIQRNSSIHESNGRGSISSARSSARLYHHGKPINVTRTTTTTTTTTAANIIEYGVECVNNKVQKQIERMFTDVAKDESTCSFSVRCLGSMPLRSKVTSLFELQEPLRKLYLTSAGQKVSRSDSNRLFWVMFIGKLVDRSGLRSTFDDNFLKICI